MPKKKKPKIGLALGAGGARGFAHIGVLKVLHKNKIYPDYIAGTSMGALIGALYAAGNSPEHIEKLMEETDWRDLLDFELPWFGLIKGRRIEKKISNDLGDKTKFEDLDIPLATVAFNVTKSQKEIFTTGNVTRAVRASISMPGLLEPARIGRHQYVDGGVVDPTPVDVVKAMGADYIISVDVYTPIPTKRGPPAKTPDFYNTIKERFFSQEAHLVENYFKKKKYPKFLIKMISLVIRRVFSPFRFLFRVSQGKQLPPIANIMYLCQHASVVELARVSSHCSMAQVKINMDFGKLTWADFDKANKFTKIGEEYAKKHLKDIKKALR